MRDRRRFVNWLKYWSALAGFACGSFTVAAAFAGPEAASSAGLSRGLTFQDAVRTAIEKSPTLQTIRLETEARENEYRNSYSVFLPQLDLGATQGLRGTEPPSATSNFVSEFSLQLSENLYDNGASLTKYESARLQRDIANLRFQNERDRLILQVAEEYHRYSLAMRLSDVQNQQFEIVNKQFRSVEGQYQQGVKTRRDYLRFKSELRRAEIDLENSRVAVRTALAELRRLLGEDAILEDRVERSQTPYLPLDIEVGSVASVPGKAPLVLQHPVYRIADLQKQVFANDVDLVRRRFWPEVFVSGNAFYRRGDYLGSATSTTYGASGDVSGWSALLTLKFNLLDWGIRRRDIEIANVRRLQGESGVQADLQGFSAETAKLMAGLERNKKNFGTAQELLDLETKSYGFLETEYRNGRASYLDIILGLRDLLSAKVQMYTSYFDLKTQLLQYRYREGTLYDFVFNK